MRSIGIVAFGITVGILAPAALVQLGAGPEQRDRLFAPGADSLELDGTRIYATIDHRMIDEGGALHLDLRAEGRVSVGIVVLGSSGTEGDRVPGPPIGVAHQTVTIEAHTTKSVPLRLAGAGERRYSMGNYTIYVMSPQAADRLARLQRRAGPNIANTDGGEIPMQSPGTAALMHVIGTIGDDDIADARNARMFARDRVASFQVWSRPVNPAIAMTVPETAPVDQAFPVVVTLRNITEQPVIATVELDMPKLDDAALALPDAAVTTDKPRPIEVAAGETKQVELHVAVKQAGVIGLQAKVRCVDGNCDMFSTGAFDAVQITSGTATVATN